MGILIATTIVLLWAGQLVWSLAFVEVSVTSPMTLFHIAFQTYLYTGLFITAHDAMHRLVSSNQKLNRFIGMVCTNLFAALSYNRLYEKHHLHHRFPGEAGDPDFCTKSQNFWRWWFSFLKNYVTWVQLVVLAIVFNILQYALKIPNINLILFWIVPSVLATFQLFYFGTYRPHRLPHSGEMMPHHSRTQRGPHWWAMLSCYFFGYHFEHHDSPQTPWWKLYQLKNQRS